MRKARSVLFALVVALPLAPGDRGEPAAISDVRHEPGTPKPGVPVLVTARLAKGLARPVLRLQAVAPGKYVRQSDPGYEKDWTDLPMRDDGQEGDEKAGDGVYSVRIPAKYQQHRWLLRYNVVATDAAGKAVRAPEAEACPNFAWWCDAGPAAWTGSRQPGKAPAVKSRPPSSTPSRPFTCWPAPRTSPRASGTRSSTRRSRRVRWSTAASCTTTSITATAARPAPTPGARTSG
ncbi:MAG TPA: choice-of-anchor X domain-containing protein [Gemmataceae bacterium]|nr:choice-of-anchor X domain-containing protein [Gemmataceae bacterium]